MQKLVIAQRERIRWLAAVSGLAIGRLAELTDSPRNIFYNFLNAKRHGISLRTWQKLASLCDVSLLWLIEGRGREPSRRAVKAALAAANRGRVRRAA